MSPKFTVTIKTPKVNVPIGNQGGKGMLKKIKRWIFGEPIKNCGLCEYCVHFRKKYVLYNGLRGVLINNYCLRILKPYNDGPCTVNNKHLIFEEK